MPSGGSQRYGNNDPQWYLEPDFQAEAGVRPLASWIDSLTVPRTAKDNGQNSDRAGNTGALQSFHKTTGAGATINSAEEIRRSAQQRTSKNWGAL